jgi:hypothetical protein
MSEWFWRLFDRAIGYEKWRVDGGGRWTTEDGGWSSKDSVTEAGTERRTSAA